VETVYLLFDYLAMDGRSLLALLRTYYANVWTNVLCGDHFVKRSLSIRLCFHGVRYESRGSAVDIATSHGLSVRGFGVRVPVRSRIVTFPYRPGRLWGPPNLTPNGYWGFHALYCSDYLYFFSLGYCNHCDFTYIFSFI
jgi:hypothetical protein